MKYPSNWPAGLFVESASHTDSPLITAWNIVYRNRKERRRVAWVERLAGRYTVISAIDELRSNVVGEATLEDALGMFAQEWKLYREEVRARVRQASASPASVETTERKIPLTPEREAELAEAFDRYTDPNSPEYDQEFTRKMREETAKVGTQGSWFPDRH